MGKELAVVADPAKKSKISKERAKAPGKLSSSLGLKIEKVKYAMERANACLHHDIKSVEFKIDSQTEMLRDIDERYTKNMRELMNRPISEEPGAHSPSEEDTQASEFKEDVSELKDDVKELKTEFKNLKKSISEIKNLLKDLSSQNQSVAPTLDTTLDINSPEPAEMEPESVPMDMLKENNISDVKEYAGRRKLKSTPFSLQHPEWQLSRKTETVPDLLKEWYGPRKSGVPSVEYLDTAYGATWRENMSFHKARKACINFIEDQVKSGDILKGLSRYEVGELLETYRINNELTLNRICNICQRKYSTPEVAEILGEMWLEKEEQ